MKFKLLLVLFVFVTTLQQLLCQTLPPNVCADLCATFQEVAFAHIEDRIHRALDYIDDNAIPVDSLVVVGGVASNLELRRCVRTLFNNLLHAVVPFMMYAVA